MKLLFSAALRALGSLFTPGMLGVFLMSVFITIGVLTGFVFGAGVFFNWLADVIQNQAWAEYLPWIGTIGAAALAWLLFPGITPIIVSFFDLRVTRLIEEHDYPAAPKPQESPFWPEFFHDVRFSLFAIFVNILALPLYLVPGLNLVLFYLLNGYLLGREYFVMVARRHVPLAEAERLRRQHGRVIMAAGALLTLWATIPLVNLAAPFWGVAVMVHLYHRVAGTPDSRLLPPQ